MAAQTAAFVVFVGLAQFFASVSGALAKLGAAVILTICFNAGGELGWCSGSLVDVAVHMAIQQLASAPIQTWQLRRHITWSFIALVILPWVICEWAGVMLLFWVPSSVWLKRGLGVMLLGVFAYETRAFWRELLGVKAAGEPKASAPAEDAVYSIYEKGHLRQTILFGVGAGFLKGFVNVPLPALLLMALNSGMSKNAWRGNSSAIHLASLPTKLYFLIFVGKQYDAARLPEYSASFAMALLAIPAGTWIASVIDEAQFRKLIVSILLVGALQLTTTGAGLVPLLVVLGGTVATALSVLLWRSLRPARPCRSELVSVSPAP